MRERIAHCKTHAGFPLNCALCKSGGIFAPEAASLRAIATHRRKGLHMTAVNRADYERNEAVAAVRASALRVGKLRPVAKAASAPKVARAAKPPPPPKPVRVAKPKPPPIVRRPHIIEHNGQSFTLDGWARVTGLSKHTIRYRLAHGIGLDIGRLRAAPSAAATEARIRRQVTYTFRGRTQTQAAWQRETGLDITTIKNRIARGIPLDAPPGTSATTGGLRGSWDYAADCAVELPPRAPRPEPVKRDGKRSDGGEQPRTMLVTFRGETMKRAEWAARLGYTEQTVRTRVRTGTPLDAPIRQGDASVRGTWNYEMDMNGVGT